MVDELQGQAQEPGLKRKGAMDYETKEWAVQWTTAVQMTHQRSYDRRFRKMMDALRFYNRKLDQQAYSARLIRIDVKGNKNVFAHHDSYPAMQGMQNTL